MASVACGCLVHSSECEHRLCGPYVSCLDALMCPEGAEEVGGWGGHAASGSGAGVQLLSHHLHQPWAVWSLSKDLLARARLALLGRDNSAVWPSPLDQGLRNRDLLGRTQLAIRARCVCWGKAQSQERSLVAKSAVGTKR